MTAISRRREGILASTTFPGLIYAILGRRETGVLTLTDATSVKSVYIQSGSPIFATSNDRDDRLGQIFLKAGLVSLENLIEALDQSLESKKRLGTVLVERGFIQPHDLVEGVLSQVRDIICSLFQCTRGRYRYLPGPLPTEEVVTLKLSAAKIILEGIRRITSWDRIWEAVGGLDAEYQVVEGLAEGARELQLSIEEWTLLAHCERRVSLRQICRLSSLRDFEVCRLLWAFLTLGIVRRVARPA